MMSDIETAALQVLEGINSRYVCPDCQNTGKEGTHDKQCLLFAVLKALRAKNQRF